MAQAKRWSLGSKQASAAIEALVIAFLASGVFALFARFDILEGLADFCRRHEAWEVDEWIGVALFLVVALALFAVRRSREALHSLRALIESTRKLEETTQEVRRLEGILPICASCKRVRDDKGQWQPVDVYIRAHTEADFTHGLCPECMAKLYPGLSQSEG